MSEKLYTPPPSLSKNGPLVRAHIFISGRVQGVFFREKAKKKAESLGVSGWIKNLSDGRVEAVFGGEREKVEKMLKWSKRGPFWAKVEHFDLIWEEYQGEFKTFEVRYDL